ncbi:hypothetical protein SVIOM74S_02224 [Streptomyces violarus]
MAVWRMDQEIRYTAVPPAATATAAGDAGRRHHSPRRAPRSACPLSGAHQHHNLRPMAMTMAERGRIPSLTANDSSRDWRQHPGPAAFNWSPTPGWTTGRAASWRAPRIRKVPRP